MKEHIKAREDFLKAFEAWDSLDCSDPEYVRARIKMKEAKTALATLLIWGAKIPGCGIGKIQGLRVLCVNDFMYGF